MKADAGAEANVGRPNNDVLRSGLVLRAGVRYQRAPIVSCGINGGKRVMKRQGPNAARGTEETGVEADLIADGRPDGVNRQRNLNAVRKNAPQGQSTVFGEMLKWVPAKSHTEPRYPPVPDRPT